MRITVLILGLMLGAFMFVQTFAVYALSGVAENETMGGASAIGILMALMWLVACSLVLPLPAVSAGLFTVAGVFGLAMAASSTFSDLSIWAVVSLMLAGLSLLGWRSKRKDARLAEAKHQELVAAMQRP